MEMEMLQAMTRDVKSAMMCTFWDRFAPDKISEELLGAPLPGRLQNVFALLVLSGHQPRFYYINVPDQPENITALARKDIPEMPQEYNNVAGYANGKWGVFFSVSMWT